ncbi:hypothetical protein P3X46_015627 [Hevea brasiliensis]|uniref:Transmembrane protein n=1 Tax=Hevea brasiliensis TaxID=3981 RepID=A0ABQ9LXW5_HEVBR|nr:uncharacterized protein LOC110636969 [Hevea brasiliensis]KAJ9172383.1 hypothetical protein P3X46_015627 [Hevea brasiliensis]
MPITMAMACLFLPPTPLLSITTTKSPRSSLFTTHKVALRFTSSSTPLRPKIAFHFHKILQRKTHVWRIYAAAEEALPSDTITPLESSQRIVSSTDDGTASIISALLFVAFVVLSVLTIGVIYLGVTDFLEKRQTEKFEKEETAKKNKNGKKIKVRARAGPRGFGQKINEDDD